jgi:hypothetical protein
MTTKTAPQKILKGILYIEEEDKHSHERQERINLTRQVDKEMRIRKESTITKNKKMTRIITYLSIVTVNINGRLDLKTRPNHLLHIRNAP